MATSNTITVDELMEQFRLTEEQCNCVIIDDHLGEISRNLVEDWRSLFSEEEMPQILKNNIEHDFKKEQEMKNAFFTQWKRRNGRTATYKKLISALLAIDNRADAEGVCDMLAKSPHLQQEKPKDQDKPKNHPSVPEDKGQDAATEDVEQTLESKRDEIDTKFAQFVVSLCEAVEATGVSLEKFKLLLQNLRTVRSCEGQQPGVLDDVKAQIKKANSIIRIFGVLSERCCSFINVDVFQSIIDTYNIDTKSNQQLQYIEHLKDYLENHTIEEFFSINPKLKEFQTGSEKLVLKFDTSLDSKITKVWNLKRAIAKVLGLLPSELRLVSIEEGCVIVTFLIPFTVASFVFESGLTVEQEKKIRDLSVLWMKCGDYRLEGNICSKKNTGLEKSGADEKEEVSKYLCIMTCGLSGTERKSLLNAISGMEILKLPATTAKVDKFTIEEKKCRLVLCDVSGIEDTAEIDDKLFEEEMSSECADVNTLLYCISVDADKTRLKYDLATLTKLYSILDKEVWNHCVIVLTSAHTLIDSIIAGGEKSLTGVKREYNKRMELFKEEVRETFKNAGIDPTRLPFVPTGAATSPLLFKNDTQPWLSILFKAVSDNSHPDRRDVLFRINSHRFSHNYSKSNEDLPLHQQKLIISRFNLQLLKAKFPTIAAALATGGTAGVAGAGIGATIGALAIGLPTFGVAAGVGLVLGGAIGGAAGVGVGAGVATAVERFRESNQDALSVGDVGAATDKETKTVQDSKK